MSLINNIGIYKTEIKDSLNLDLSQSKNRKNLKEALQENLVLKEGDSISLRGRLDSLVSGVREAKEVLSSQKFHETYLNSLYYILDQIQQLIGKAESSPGSSSSKTHTINELNSYKATLTRLSSLYSSDKFKEIFLEEIGNEASIKIPVNIFTDSNKESLGIGDLSKNIENFLNNENESSKDLKISALDVKSLEKLNSYIVTSYMEIKSDNIVNLLK